MPTVAFFYCVFFLSLLCSSTLCVPLLLLSETPEFPDCELLRFDGVCLAVFATLAFLLHSVRIPCALFFFLRFGVVGLFGRVLFVTGCFKGFRCPPVFLWVGGFLLG